MRITGKAKTDISETLDRQEVFEYLAKLRDSTAIIGVLEVGSYIQDTFGCSSQEARHWLLEWIESF